MCWVPGDPDEGAAIAAENLYQCEATIADLEATVARLKARGIEDMQFRISELETLCDEILSEPYLSVDSKWLVQDALGLERD
jgi:hypothetical protein